MTSDTDSIRKQIVLRAPRERVWSAITDSTKFGTWFGVAFEEAFVAGRRVRGRIVPTKVDAEIAKAQEPHAGIEFEVLVERIEPMQRFEFRWHPGAEVPEAESPDDQMTLVTFEIDDAQGGVLLTITESGFDRVPLERRAEAFAANDGGWQAQTKLLEKYLADAS